MKKYPDLMPPSFLFQPGNGSCKSHLLLFLSKGRTVCVSSLAYSNTFSHATHPRSTIFLSYLCIIDFQYILLPFIFLKPFALLRPDAHISTVLSAKID